MLGKKLKGLRSEYKITQEELAKIIGVTTSMIGMYETDSRKPSYEVLLKISEYFNVSTDYLLGKTDKRTNISKPNPDPYAPITDVKQAMEIIMAQPGLMLNGEILDDEDKIILANSIQMGLKVAEELREKKKKENK
jgi:transcriptional regulator with XRE-family HTH domain